MKNIFYILSIVMAGILIGMVSCTKEEVKTSNDSTTNLSPRDMQVNSLIRHFKNEIAMYRENPQLKSGETVPADSALWYLEATINYSHAFPNAYYQQFKIDTSYLTVPVNADGTVDMVLLTQKYDVMIADVSTFYYNSSFEDKGLVLVDITGSSQTGGELTFEVEAVIGNKGIDPGPGPFVEGDDWWYGEIFGHCYPHTYDSDAAHKLAESMNSYIATQNMGLFFVNPTNVIHKGGDFRRDGDPEPPNNVYDYYLYSTSTENGTITDENGVLCLNYNEMNVYYDLLKQLVYTKIPEAEMPPGYKIEKIMWMIGDKEPDGPYIHYYNRGKFKYAYPIAYMNGEGPSGL